MDSSRIAGTSLRHLIALGAFCLALPACSHTVDVNSPQIRGIGYVRLDDVVKKHPLYGQLSQLDSNIDALNLRTLAPAVPKTGTEIARESAELNRELDTARTHANAVLQQKQIDYASRENAAIAAAMKAAGETSGQNPAAAMRNTAAQQAASVSAQANHDFAAYQQTLITQDQAATRALTQQYAMQADRQYRKKADELSARESQESLDMASKDAPQRLALRTRLSNLALDDSVRASVKSQLAALDKKEQDDVAAMRARDRAALSAYQQQLRSQTSAAIASQARSIHAQTSAKIAARRNTISAQVSSQLGSLGPAGSSNLTPATQSKIKAIDKQYKAQFQADVNRTIAEFQATRNDLNAQFAALHGADSGAQGAVAKQLGSLHKQRDALYGQIVSQVKREVASVATQKGLRVVFVNVVSPAGGVDLTDDVAKDVESLHE